MSIDTYDTLAMILPSAERRYDLHWIEQIAHESAGAPGQPSRTVATRSAVLT